ncbi:MAG: hypothetical protein WC988_01475 [Patescibacteria group bacterium]
MSNKEQISTLITTGATLPPVNPYLDDSVADDDSSINPLVKKKPGRVPAKTTAPDPKEYIAELERPENESLF